MLSRTSLLVAAGVFFLPGLSPAQDTREVFRGNVPEGSWLRVRTMSGDIEVREGSGQTAVVVARLGGGSGETPRFEVKRDGSSVTICAIYEGTTECSADKYETRWQRDNRRQSAHFSVQLPRGVKLLASTGNGDVESRGATEQVTASSGNGEITVAGSGGRVRASSGNGDIEVTDAKGPVNASSGNGDIIVRTTAGPVTASSGNGRIRVRMESLAEEGNMNFSTGNGSIELGLPANVSADIEANVGIRNFETDFPMQLPGRWSSGRIEGKIGQGGRRIRMSTGNGSVSVKRN